MSGCSNCRVLKGEGVFLGNPKDSVREDRGTLGKIEEDFRESPPPPPLKNPIIKGVKECQKMCYRHLPKLIESKKLYLSVNCQVFVLFQGKGRHSHVRLRCKMMQQETSCYV